MTKRATPTHPPSKHADGPQPRRGNRSAAHAAGRVGRHRPVHRALLRLRLHSGQHLDLDRRPRLARGAARCGDLRWRRVAYGQCPPGERDDRRLARRRGRRLVRARHDGRPAVERRQHRRPERQRSPRGLRAGRDVCRSRGRHRLPRRGCTRPGQRDRSARHVRGQAQIDLDRAPDDADYQAGRRVTVVALPGSTTSAESTRPLQPQGRAIQEAASNSAGYRPARVPATQAPTACLPRAAQGCRDRRGTRPAR